MKKTFTITLFILIPLLSFSQNKFGVFAGMNRTLFTTGFFVPHPSDSYKSNGFHIGGLYEFELNENISFRPKLVLSQQGYRINYMTNVDSKPTFLNLPLNFKFFKKTYLLIGPQFGYIINQKKSEELYENVNSFDYGINLGVGRELNDLFFEFNIYRGFKDRLKDIFNKGGKDTVFQLSIGYNFE